MLNQGIPQVSEKYLALESVAESYLVIFNPGTPVGGRREPRYHTTGSKRVTAVATIWRLTGTELRFAIFF